MNPTSREVVTQALSGLKKAGIHVEGRHNVTVPGTLTTPDESLHLLNRAIREAGAFSLYIGLNICKYKCLYCRYHSRPVRMDQVPATIDRILEEVTTEAKLTKNSLPESDSALVSSLYIGGGTPTLMSEAQLERLLAMCHRSFRLSSATEVSMEGTPDLLTSEAIMAMKRRGVNRISMGIQRLDDDWLARMKRGNSVKDILQALETLAASGVRFNVDLMCGFEDQTIESFLSGLERVLGFEPHEITVYFFEDEYQWSRKALKAVRPADPFTAYLMWQAGRELCLKVGRHEAPMGWWLRPDVSRSQVYVDRWFSQVPLVGFGTAAYSFSRYQQYTNLLGSAYQEALAQGRPPIDPTRAFRYSPGQQRLRKMAFELKSVFQTEVGGEQAFFESLEKAGLGTISRNDQTFALSKEGIVVIEEIMRALIEKSQALGEKS